MLAGLKNIPHTNDDWSKWSLNHRLSHDRIRQAIKAHYGYDLTDHLVDPMDPKAMEQFLQNNSELHDDMNSALSLPGVDLQDTDLSKPNELESWINFHYLEHQSAEFKLGTGS